MRSSPVTSRRASRWQLFKELTAQMTTLEPSFEGDLAQADEKLGAGFLENLTAAMGTEAAFALNGFSVNGPTWVMAALANNPAVIDSSLQKLVETFNAELGPDDQAKRIVLASGERGRTGLEHDEAGIASIGRDLDVRSGLHGGGLRSRVRGARDRNPERRLPARLVAGSSRASSLRRPGSTRPRSPG